jgi:hypothetical protein
MKFKEAVEGTPNLADAYKEGLQALRAQDRKHIEAEDPRKLRGSVDVDLALRAEDPHGNRWDFAIAYQHTNHQDEFVYWVEPHTASDSQIDVVIKKANWLLKWLKQPGNLLDQFKRDIVWVSSGRTSLTLSSPQSKRMALAGLTHKGQILRIPDVRPVGL